MKLLKKMLKEKVVKETFKKNEGREKLRQKLGR
jgi:hypothetical protein